MILLFITVIQINLYTNKDSYLVGEDIWVGWEIINRGESQDYYMRGGKEWFMLSGYVKVWDKYDEEIPHVSISVLGSNGKRGKSIATKKINSCDTIKIEDVNIIGSFGKGRFGGGRYIKSGEYSISFYLPTGKSSERIVWSDTISFIVTEPEGKDKEAWDLYKKYRFETYQALEKKDEERRIKCALKIVKLYPNSAYTNTIINQIRHSFHLYRTQSYFKENIEEMRGKTRELLNYIKQNIDKFSKNERTLQNTLWCIIDGELMLGTSKEYIKEQILQLDISLNKEIKEFFGN